MIETIELTNHQFRELWPHFYKMAVPKYLHANTWRLKSMLGRIARQMKVAGDGIDVTYHQYSHQDAIRHRLEQKPGNYRSDFYTVTAPQEVISLLRLLL